MPSPTARSSEPIAYVRRLIVSSLKSPIVRAQQPAQQGPPRHHAQTVTKLIARAATLVPNSGASRAIKWAKVPT